MSAVIALGSAGICLDLSWDVWAPEFASVFAPLWRLVEDAGAFIAMKQVYLSGCAQNESKCPTTRPCNKWHPRVPVSRGLSLPEASVL